MVTESEIRCYLVQFLDKDIDLDTFANWFAENTWNIHRQEDQSAQELAYSIELLLAEHSSGHLSKDELRTELLPLVTSYIVSLSTFQTGSSSDFIEQPLHWPSVDIQLL